MIGIIDYGSGNVGAIANIYKQLKIEHVITDKRSEIESADRIILPGVGHFDTTMAHIRRSGLFDLLNEQVVTKKKKVLGICVGMQLLADSSEEGTEAGFGWISGRVKLIDKSKLKMKPTLPHMGWNSIEVANPSALLDGVDNNKGFYFLHSYYFDATVPADVCAKVNYGSAMTCGVQRGHVYGFQFHPEKSHGNGMTLFRNFATI